jgi:hypothetical protein
MKLPPGWKLVPEEPTEAMMVAYRGALKDMIERLPPGHKDRSKPIREPFKGLGRWRAMLKAAPPPPFTANVIVSLNMMDALREQHRIDEAQRVCQHLWPHRDKPMPASWSCACGTKVYRSREDAIDD